MPEGHSIHRIARQFNDVFTGESVRVSSPQGRYTDGAALLDGASVLNAYAHGKHLFVPFNNELTLNVHLGIYGNLYGCIQHRRTPEDRRKRIYGGGGRRIYRTARAERHYPVPHRFRTRLG